MFYITKVSKNCINVMDTTDNVEESLTREEVLKAEKMGYEVKGVIHYNGTVYFCPYSADLLRIDSLALGTPVMVCTSKNLGFEQTLYVGKRFMNNKLIFNFYNNSGVTGYFGLSSEYIVERNVKFDFDNNDAFEVVGLLHSFKGI